MFNMHITTAIEYEVLPIVLINPSFNVIFFGKAAMHFAFNWFFLAYDCLSQCC